MYFGDQKGKKPRIIMQKGKRKDRKQGGVGREGDRKEIRENAEREGGKEQEGEGGRRGGERKGEGLKPHTEFWGWGANCSIHRVIL